LRRFSRLFSFDPQPTADDNGGRSTPWPSPEGLGHVRRHATIFQRHLDDARAGSKEAFGKLINTCARVLYHLGNTALGDALRPKKGGSDRGPRPPAGRGIQPGGGSGPRPAGDRATAAAVSGSDSPVGLRDGIGRRLGCSADAARKVFERARRRLAKILGGADGEKEA
jgi:hypothetical protein